jgi:hypothetical protein
MVKAAEYLQQLLVMFKEVNNDEDGDTDYTWSNLPNRKEELAYSAIPVAGSRPTSAQSASSAGRVCQKTQPPTLEEPCDTSDNFSMQLSPLGACDSSNVVSLASEAQDPAATPHLQESSPGQASRSQEVVEVADVPPARDPEEGDDLGGFCFWLLIEFLLGGTDGEIDGHKKAFTEAQQPRLQSLEYELWRMCVELKKREQTLHTDPFLGTMAQLDNSDDFAWVRSLLLQKGGELLDGGFAQIVKAEGALPCQGEGPQTTFS